METISDKCLPPMLLTPLRTQVLLHPPPPGYKHVQSTSVQAVAAVYLRLAHITRKGPKDLSMCYVKEASHTPKTALAEGDLVRNAVLFSLGLVPPAGLRSVLQHRPQLQNELIHYSKANRRKESRLNLLLFLPYDTVPWPGHLTGDKKQDLEQPCLRKAGCKMLAELITQLRARAGTKGKFHSLLSAMQLKANISHTLRCINENTRISMICSWPGTALDGGMGLF